MGGPFDEYNGDQSYYGEMLRETDSKSHNLNTNPLSFAANSANPLSFASIANCYAQLSSDKVSREIDHRNGIPNANPTSFAHCAHPPPFASNASTFTTNAEPRYFTSRSNAYPHSLFAVNPNLLSFASNARDPRLFAPNANSTGFTRPYSNSPCLSTPDHYAQPSSFAINANPPGFSHYANRPSFSSNATIASNTDHPLRFAPNANPAGFVPHANHPCRTNHYVDFPGYTAEFALTAKPPLFGDVDSNSNNDNDFKHDGSVEYGRRRLDLYLKKIRKDGEDVEPQPKQEGLQSVVKDEHEIDKQKVASLLRNAQPTRKMPNGTLIYTAAINQGQGGYGAVVSDYDGKPIVAASGVSGPVSMRYYELRGVWLGLELARKQGLDRVEMLTDSEDVVLAVNKHGFHDDVDCHDVVVQILEIIQLLRSEFTCSAISLIPRSMNEAAYYMASRGKKMEYNF